MSMSFHPTALLPHIWFADISNATSLQPSLVSSSCALCINTSPGTQNLIPVLLHPEEKKRILWNFAPAPASKSTLFV